MSLRLITDAAMVFLPVGGYVSQYFEIMETRNSEGFSSFISLILVVANVVRLFYWLFDSFALSLVFQSVVMILAQMALIELIVRTRKKNNPDSPSITLLDWKWDQKYISQYFWRWTDFLSYIFVVFAFIWVCSTLSYIFQGDFFGSLLGYLALGTEACLAIPQVTKNFANKSTKGLNNMLIMSWALGDSFKLVYFINESQPLPFILCAVFQLAMDAVIFLQIYFYRRSKAMM